MHADDFAQLQLLFVDQTQWRYEVIRPVVLFADRTPRQRAQETHTHPATVRRLTRRFQQRGLVGLLPDAMEVVVRGRAKRILEAVRQEIERLKVLYDGFHYRELARILFIKFGEPIDHKTVKTMWHESPVSVQGRLDFLDYHAYPDRSQARQVLGLPWTVDGHPVDGPRWTVGALPPAVLQRPVGYADHPAGGVG